MVDACNRISTSGMINIDDVQSGVFSWVNENESQQGQKNCFAIKFKNHCGIFVSCLFRHGA